MRVYTFNTSSQSVVTAVRPFVVSPTCALLQGLVLLAQYFPDFLICYSAYCTFPQDTSTSNLMLYDPLVIY
jgi:hypothetical protein